MAKLYCVITLDKPMKFFSRQIDNIGVWQPEPHHQFAPVLRALIKDICDRIHKSTEESAADPENTKTFSPNRFNVRRKAIRGGMKNDIERPIRERRKIVHQTLSCDEREAVTARTRIILCELLCRCVEHHDLTAGRCQNGALLATS